MEKLWENSQVETIQVVLDRNMAEILKKQYKILLELFFRKQLWSSSYRRKHLKFLVEFSKKKIGGKRWESSKGNFAKKLEALKEKLREETTWKILDIGQENNSVNNVQ